MMKLISSKGPFYARDYIETSPVSNLILIYAIKWCNSNQPIAITYLSL